MKQIIKYLAAFVLALVMIVGVSTTNALAAEIDSDASEVTDKEVEGEIEPELTVRVLYIGQGDSILLESNGHWMLVDGGPVSAGKTVVEALSQYGCDKLDLVLSTHGHSDHVGGLAEVIRSVAIEELWMNAEPDVDKAYTDFISELRKSGISSSVPKAGQKYQLGSCEIEVIAPILYVKSDDLNTNSIVFRVKCGERSFLFTGDCTKETEEILVNKGVDLSADVLKVAHHGSRNSSSDIFLDAVSPEYAVISCGIENENGKPDMSALQRLDQHHIPYFQTDQNGTITFWTNGELLSYSGEWNSNPVITPRVLPAPAIISVSNASGGAYLKWTLIEQAAEYRVFRKIYGGSYSMLADVQGTTYLDESVVSGTKYVYTIRCRNADGSYASEQPAGKSLLCLSTPVISSVKNSTGGVGVKWSITTGAEGYYIYRKTGNENYQKINTVTGQDSCSFTDKEAKSGVKYTYAVRAYRNSTLSSLGSKSLLRLANPTLSGVTNTSTGVKVAWAKTPGATGYYVYRKTGSGDYKKIKSIASATTLSWTDTTAATGTKYTYMVRAYNGTTLSSYAGKSIVRLLTPAISKLTNVTGRKMKVTWGKKSGVTGYQIQYSTSSTFASGNKSVSVTGASTVSKTISSLTKGKTYYVRVRSYKTLSDVKYYSGWSAKKSVKISK